MCVVTVSLTESALRSDALADSISASGLSAAAGCQLLALRGWSLPAVQLATVFGINFATNWTSNAATTIIALPIIAALAQNLGVNPLLLLVPATLSTSFAFMLPIATPPNAIVFSSGELRIVDMAKPGLVANTVCAAFLWGYFQLLAPAGGEPFALLAALLQGSDSADWFEAAAPGSNETAAAAC